MNIKLGDLRRRIADQFVFDIKVVCDLDRILVPPVTSTTVGSRAFPVAAPLHVIWNSLPDDVISAESLPTFQRKLKRHLFCQSFPGFGY